MPGLLATCLATAEAVFQQWTTTLLIVLILMIGWLVFAQHRLARNQVEIAQLLRDALARPAGDAAPDEDP